MNFKKKKNLNRIFVFFFGDGSGKGEWLCKEGKGVEFAGCCYFCR